MEEVVVATYKKSEKSGDFGYIMASLQAIVQRWRTKTKKRASENAVHLSKFVLTSHYWILEAQVFIAQFVNDSVHRGERISFRLCRKTLVTKIYGFCYAV